MRDRIGAAAAPAARHPHNSAPDMNEALRRATGTPPAVRVLAAVADQLEKVNPGRLMDEGALRLLVHRCADPDRTGRACTRRTADAARAAAPPIDPGVTRRRYARMLRKTVTAGVENTALRRDLQSGGGR